MPFLPHVEENKLFEEQTVFVNESLETMLLLLRVANIYTNALDKKEYLVKKDRFTGKLKYLKCRHWPIYAGFRPCDYHNYRMTHGFAELANRIYCQTRDIMELTLL